MEPEQHSRGVRRPTAQARRDGDALVQGDAHPTLDTRGLAKRQGRAQREIRGVCRNPGSRGPELDRLDVFEDDPVGELHSLHHRDDLVITIGAPRQDFERQVDLGRSAELDPPPASRPAGQSIAA